MRNRMRKHDAQGKHGKIQRPDTQDAARVEQPERYIARFLAVPAK